MVINFYKCCLLVLLCSNFNYLVNNDLQISAKRLYSDRTLGGDYHHRDVDRLAFACSAESAERRC